MDRDAILSLGWRQGASTHFPRIEECVGVQTQELKSLGKKYLVVISQDCDVASVNLGDEPLIECLVCERLKSEKENARLFNCWNPRKLHIELSGHYYEFKAKNMCFIRKKDILAGNIRPDFSIVSESDLDGDSFQLKLRKLRQWKVNRYVRTGLPESFAAKARDIFGTEEFINALRAYEPSIETLYIRLRPFSETPDGCYSVGIIALKKGYRPDETVDFDLEKMIVEHLLIPLAGIPGIVVDNSFDENEGTFDDEDLSTIMSKADFPILLEESFVPYYFDPISMEADEESEIATEA